MTGTNFLDIFNAAQAAAEIGSAPFVLGSEKEATMAQSPTEKSERDFDSRYKLSVYSLNND